MNKFQVSQVVGNGTYGCVLSAVNKETKETVAIKKMKRKYKTWEECIQLREVMALRKLIHPNIIKLREVIRENDELHLIFDSMDCNLYQLIKDRPAPFSENRVRSMMNQILQALAYMHRNGYFHRDIKPENFLVTKETVKLADFGLAREIRSRPPFTEYVSTRWYRAPEVLLRAANYNSPVDLWACGCILSELFTLRPLFPGVNETDQLSRIGAVLGAPTVGQWAEGHRLAAVLGYRFPPSPPALFLGCSPEGAQVLQGMLVWEPMKRLTAEAALALPFFGAHAEDPPEFAAPILRPAKVEVKAKSIFASQAAKSILS